MDLLKAELIKLKHNKTLWISILFLAGIYIILSNTMYSTIPENPSQIAGKDISRSEIVFIRVIADNLFPMWMGIFFSSLLVGFDFFNRSINMYIFTGNIKRNIFCIKLVEYYVLSICITALFPMICLIRFSMPHIITLEMSYLFKCIGLRLLFDIALLSFAFMFSFLFKDILKASTVCLIFTLIISQMTQSASQSVLIENIMSFYPSMQYQRITSLASTGENILPVISVSVAIIVFTNLIAFIYFKRSEMR